MGGLPCWKDIIDQRNALVQQLDCMCESIRIAGAVGGTGIMPTDEDRAEFFAASEALAKVADKIQRRVSGR